MNDKLLYLDTYVLQKDMRVRLPKSVLSNLNLTKGESEFDIYLDVKNDSLVLKLHSQAQCK